MLFINLRDEDQNQRSLWWKAVREWKVSSQKGVVGGRFLWLFAHVVVVAENRDPQSKSPASGFFHSYCIVRKEQVRSSAMNKKVYLVEWTSTWWHNRQKEWGSVLRWLAGYQSDWKDEQESISNIPPQQHSCSNVSSLRNKTKTRNILERQVERCCLNQQQLFAYITEKNGLFLLN